MKTAAWVAVMAALIGAPALATDNLFVGSWKTNPDKSHVTGRTVTYSKTANGFHFAGATGQAYDFATDGADYPAEVGELIAWTAAGDNKWQTTTKLKGKVILTGQIEISQDGKTMTERYSAAMPDGTQSPGKVVRTRLSGGPGLAGTWTTKEATVDPELMIVSEPAPGRLRMDTPSRKEVVEGPTDGTPFTISGPEIPEHWYATFRLKDATTLEWSGGFKDKPRVQGVDTVSSDGRVLTAVYWYVGKEGEKFTEVSDKQ